MSGALLYLARVTPPYPLDVTPFAFAFTAMGLAWSLFRLRMLNVVPVAQRAIRSTSSSVASGRA